MNQFYIHYELQNEILYAFPNFEHKQLLKLRIPSYTPDNKVHGASMGHIWVLSTPCGPHVGLMNLAIWDLTGNVMTLSVLGSNLINVKKGARGSPFTIMD